MTCVGNSKVKKQVIPMWSHGGEAGITNNCTMEIRKGKKQRGKERKRKKNILWFERILITARAAQHTTKNKREISN